MMIERAMNRKLGRAERTPLVVRVMLFSAAAVPGAFCMLCNAMNHTAIGMPAITGMKAADRNFFHILSVNGLMESATNPSATKGMNPMVIQRIGRRMMKARARAARMIKYEPVPSMMRNSPMASSIVSVNDDAGLVKMPRFNNGSNNVAASGLSVAPCWRICAKNVVNPLTT